jgi:signal transduction histidine kinase
MQHHAKHRVNDPITEAIEGFIPALRRWEDLVTRVEDFAAIVANEDFAVKFEKIDAAKVLAEVAESWEPLAVNRELNLTVESSEGEICADPQLLKRVIAVALSNALKVSKPGTTIRIVFRRADHCVEIVVEDTGSGMSGTDRALFMQGRLPRSDPHRPGLGLGQILLRAYCKALKAETVCEPQKDREGLAVGVRLPINHR